MLYRNAKLLALAKEAPFCFHCFMPNDGTVVAAHANMQSMGKGTGIKAADVVAFLCQFCHGLIDAGSLTRGKKEGMWCRAAVHSMRWALENHSEVFCQRRPQ